MSNVNLNTDSDSVYFSSYSNKENVLHLNKNADNDVSIFTSESLDNSKINLVENLREEFQNVQDEQGIIGKAWNGLKNLVGIGVSSNKVENKIEQYENGEITYDEALEYIETYETKQEGGVNLITNLASGAATAGLAFATGGFGALAAGAVIGGAAKAGLKTADRATNKVEGDALDAKQIAKDTMTGAVDGVLNAATGGMIKGATAGQSVKTAIKEGIKQGAKAGALSGAAAGAAEYTAEAAFEDDVDFELSGFVKSTATNAAAGAVMGGVIGGVTGGVQQHMMNKSSAKTVEVEAETVKTSETKPASADEAAAASDAGGQSKFKVSHDKKLGAAVDNAEQADLYAANWNENHSGDKLISETDMPARKARLEELSKEAEELAVRFDSQIDEAAEQVDAVFSDKSQIEQITARSKGQKSTFSKLAKKNIEGKELATSDACYDAIGDALGVRIQASSVDEATSRKVVEEILSKKGIDGSYDDFARYLSGDETVDFSSVKGEILDALKTKQMESTVKQLVKGIKSGKLRITEINNYGDGTVSYFTDAQMAEIVDAYQYAVEHGIVTSDKAFEVVNSSDIFANNVDINAEGNAVKRPSSDLVTQNAKKATKDSGYPSFQTNTKHTLADGTVANGELQIRGTRVNDFADVEHIPYDIRTGKIWGEAKYDSVSSLIKNMSETDFTTYNGYLADTYRTLRLQELGLLSSDAPLPDLTKYTFEALDDSAKSLLSYAGLKALSAKH